MTLKGEEKMVPEQEDIGKTIEERMADEALVKERTDEEGNKWTKVYFGGGEHFKNWLDQCKELGEVMVEEVDSTGYTCFDMAGEKLFRIWMKVNDSIDEERY
jgi:hypothetical protein